ncbi:MAG TPA: hypothetical protein VI540_10065 [Gaiellaceae bacterium]|nr:hypothetical protein [Gaiellaceae bacterium]
MADAPWRCSECGTINEPVANSCRTCGRWPSLFDLEESSLENVRTSYASDEPRLEVERLEPETFEVEEMPIEMVDEEEAEPESAASRRRRLITSLIVPLAFVVYIVISIIVGDRG